ncbi:hypothetical protein Hrd1104_08600 [Halorhabdus sp. CBA1104]|uniref:hypothetical protein n=1 Tax=Halorhabdus sp. CBA1104 TaxID=1380432 RepID=UPI0012B3FC8E|nr:hypothetical protein [Halorhabdus sp. CBA1104]QGN07359.1 hypothetical protein Hrd1104_08600 [Halorhabdus sp. CBA1104]
MDQFGRSDSRRSDPTAASGVAVAERVDTTYALASGLYVAGLVTPGALALVGYAGLDDAAALYVAFLTLVTVTTIGSAFIVCRLAGVPEWVGRSLRQWAFVAVAGITAGGYIAVGGVVGFPFETTFLAAFVVAVVGGLFGLLLAAMSRARYVDAVVVDEPIESEWAAGWPRRWQIGAWGTGLALMTLGLVTFLDSAPGGTAVAVLGGIGYVSGSALLNFGQPWTYRVRPSGLERTRSVIRRLERWGRIVSVEKTETTLVIRRRGWWRPPIYCAWSDLDDAETVREDLERYVSGSDRAR